MRVKGEHITGWGCEKGKNLGWEVDGAVFQWTAHTEQEEPDDPRKSLVPPEHPPHGLRATLSTHFAFGVSAQEEQTQGETGGGAVGEELGGACLV